MSLGRGLRVNVGTGGVGVSGGRRGARVSVSSSRGPALSLGFLGFRWLKRL